MTNILHNFSESYTQVISAQTVYLVIARALHVHYFAKFPIFFLFPCTSSFQEYELSKVQKGYVISSHLIS